MSRRIIFSVFAAVAFLVPTVSGQSAPVWQKFTSPTGRFELLYPAKPSAKVDTKRTASGELQMNFLSTEVNGTAYIAMYADHDLPATDVPASLLNSQQSAVRDMNATLISSTQINHLGHLARYYKVRLPYSDGKFYIGTVMVMYVGRRQYQVIAVYDEAKPDAAAAAKFISSFRLVQPSGVARR